MSVLFPKVNKPPTWDYRPIYYDPKKDEMDRKLAALQAKRAAEMKAKGEEAALEGNDEAKEASAEHSAGASKPYVPTLHRGSFREAHEAGMSSYRAREERKTKLRIWVVILVLLLFGIYLLGLM